MKKLYTFLSLSLATSTLLTPSATASSQQRIPIVEDKPLEIYALGAGGTNTGVYKINPTDYSTTKISGTTYTQYTGSYNGGGGTFLDDQTVVGVKNAGSYSFLGYAFEATATGGEDGPWSHTYYASISLDGKVYDMTYDATNGDIYCWYQVSTFQNSLGKYDRATHTITRVGSAPSATIFAIAIDSKGTLWGVGSYGQIYKIDKSTGEAIEMTGYVGCGLQFQSSMPISAAIDPASDLMYVVGRLGTYDTYSSLATVDLETMTGTKLCQFESYYNCLSIAGSAINDKAPGEATELTATFDGATTTVTFTAPTRTYGDTNLTGTLDYTVTSDDGQSANGTVAPGETKSINMQLADGMRQISVSFSNSEGDGPAKKTTLFVGYDTPTPLSGLTITTDGETVDLNWDMPTGVNGGMLNTEALSFSITRDGETIAEGLTTPHYTDKVDGAPAERHYEVSTIYNAERLHTAAISIVAGAPLTLPYTPDFSSLTTFGEAGITVVDPNTGNYGVSPTWAITNDENDGTIFTSPALNASAMYAYWRTDFLYLPPMQLHAGVNYTLSFDAAARASLASQEQQARLRIVMANTPTADLSQVKDIYHADSEENGDTLFITSAYGVYDWTSHQVSFTVEADGVYSLAFLDWAPNSYNYYYTAIKDIKVEAQYSTPSPVTGLTAEPQPDNNRNIDLTFTLPTTAVDGTTLTDITKVEIMRGTTLIATLTEGLTPGRSVTYTDEMAPRGIRSYNVTVYCGSKSSAKEYTSVKVGYVKNLTLDEVEASATEVAINGEMTIDATVRNDGFEQVLTGAYYVCLLADGEVAEVFEGTGLATDETARYTFYIFWDEEKPRTVKYTVTIDFDGDENLADNTSSEFEIEFEQKLDNVDTVSTEATVRVTAADNTITVTGAEGMTVEVFTTTGLKVAATATAPATFTTAPLTSGTYIVKAGATATKVAL